jgi:hypothetical protein
MKPSAPQNQVIIIGPATLDTVVTSNGTVRKIGGVPTYAGLTFRRHGVAVMVLTNIAPADRPHFGAYSEAGIRLVAGQTDYTTHFVNRESASGRVQELPATAAPINHGLDVLADSSTGHVHLGPLFPDDISPALLQAMERLTLFKSLDLQGYVRRVRDGKVEPGVPHRDELSLALSLADIVKGDELEIQTVLDALGMGMAEVLHQFEIGSLLITDGRNGGRLVKRDGAVIPYAPLPLVETNDTTGAGDVFFAAYLSAWHHRGCPEQEALNNAARTAAAHVEGHFISPRSLFW